jgi:hypothetical protein
MSFNAHMLYSFEKACGDVVPAQSDRPGRCHVIELDKSRIFIYIPWTKSGFLTFFTYTLTGLFYDI